MKALLMENNFQYLVYFPFTNLTAANLRGIDAINLAGKSHSSHPLIIAIITYITLIKVFLRALTSSPIIFSLKYNL